MHFLKPLEKFTSQLNRGIYLWLTSLGLYSLFHWMSVIRRTIVSNNRLFINLSFNFQIISEVCSNRIFFFITRKQFCKWNSRFCTLFHTNLAVCWPIGFMIYSLVCVCPFPFTKESCFYFYKASEKNTHPYCYLLLEEKTSLFSKKSVSQQPTWWWHLLFHSWATSRASVCQRLIYIKY